ncbi:MAG: EAL domain-containing protein [Eubacteriales bacterium]|nr:EAL domain-containing protein [Eubacteriales bacterium]
MAWVLTAEEEPEAVKGRGLGTAWEFDKKEEGSEGMEKTLKNEFGLSRRSRAGIAAVMALFLLTSAFVYAKLYRGIEEVAKNQAVRSVTNISELNADSVSRALRNRQALLESFAINLSRKKIRDLEKILSEMDVYRQTYQFYDMGILTEDMNLHLTSGEVIDVSENLQYRRAWSEAFRVSESYMPVDGGEYMVNLFSVPVYYDRQKVYVLTAAYYSIYLTERMNINSLDEKGYNFLLDKEGKTVITPPKYSDEKYIGLMDHINGSSELIPGGKADGSFVYNGEPYYAHFEGLDINGWYLLTCIREDDVFSDAGMIIHGVFLGMGALWLQILLALVFILYLFWRSKKKTQEAVFYDHLLGIENGEFLSVFFQKIPQKEYEGMALTILDIDKFKEFNYLYGEECGDHLLRYITQVFQEELPEEYLFRYLSDHFVVLIHCKDQEEFCRKFERVLGRFARDMDHKVIQPFDISAGVRRMKEGDNFRRVVSDALLAKGTVKGIQIQQYAFYDEELRLRRMDYMEMESDFYRALRNGEFQVYYQPKYNMRTGEIVGSEALVRWVKQTGEVISPASFIPCFESSRQVIYLDETVLESVCRQMKEMEAEGISVRQVSVNLSRVHLRHHGILGKISRIIKETGVNPAMLAFEITESALYEDSIPLKNIVDHLHELGCRVHMDDYGVGVSGANALVTNEFDVVKMDKSFISGIGSRKMETVIRSTIRLSQELGMEIVAEGVEEKYQADKLVEWGCVMAQGFYYSVPVPEAEYRRMLRENETKRK